MDQGRENRERAVAVAIAHRDRDGERGREGGMGREGGIEGSRERENRERAVAVAIAQPVHMKWSVAGCPDEPCQLLSETLTCTWPAANLQPGPQSQPAS